MKCEHCGWADDGKAVEVELIDWPEGMPHPPPFPEHEIHPTGMCPSRLKVGDQVFWTAGDADLAPLLGEFISVSEIRGPKFTLKAGVWTMIRSGGTPLKAFVKFAEEEREVDYVDITIITKWPVLLP